MPTLRCAAYELSLDQPLVMGIVNVTPDSFSDGGRYFAASAAIDHARALIDEGADLLDVGAESSRPGARPIDATEELDRLLPVLEALQGCGVPLSVDTTKAVVMRAVLAQGAAMINDISALSDPEALAVIAAHDCAVCLMHMQGEPQSMQRDPQYLDVVAEVRAFLAARIDRLTAAGIGCERIVVDPGFGFGKTRSQNFELLRSLERIVALGQPVLAGLSRKSMLRATPEQPASARLPASIAAALSAVCRGATLLRVHDVAATRQALTVWQMVENHALIDFSELSPGQ